MSILFAKIPKYTQAGEQARIAVAGGNILNVILFRLLNLAQGYKTVSMLNSSPPHPPL